MRHLQTILARAALLALAGCSSAEAAKEHEKAGIEALQQGRNEDAVRELLAANEADPGLYQAAMTLAAMNERAGDRARAVAILERLTKERPKLAFAHMGLGDLYVRLGRYDDALRTYGRVAEINAHPPALLGMASIYRRRGQEAAAERAILAALESQPGDVAARHALAKLYDEHGGDEAAARAAWERYHALAIGQTGEATRLEEARARLRDLASHLTPEEKGAALGLVRGVLRPPPPGIGAAMQDGAGWRPREGTPERAAWDALERYFPGRAFVTLYSPDVSAPVRGVGRGATLAEALAEAGLDAKRSRVYDLQLAQSLSRVRIAVDIEAGAPGSVASDTFRPGRDALEVARGGRSSVVLPADQAALGIASFERALAVGAQPLGLDLEAARGAELGRFETVAFIEASEGASAALDVVEGLPAPPEATAREALAAARAAAVWVASSLSNDGVFAGGYDPREERWLEGVTGTALQLDLKGALARLAAPVGEPRLRSAAAFAEQKTGAASLGLGSTIIHARRLRTMAALESSEAAALAAGLARLPADEAALGGTPREEAALAALALAEAGARDAASRLALALASGDAPDAAALPAIEVLLGSRPAAAGAPDPALEAAARLLGPRAIEEAAARPAGDLVSLERLVAAARLPKALRPPGIDQALQGAVAESLALSIDDRAAYPFRERPRFVGGFRSARLDPVIRSDLTLRRAEALARAAAVLP